MADEIVDGLYGSFQIFGHDVGIRLALKQFGAYQASNLRMLLDAVSDGFHVLDLGAHVGTFCVAIARQAGPTGKVIAVEGTPSTYELLRRNIAANHVAWAHPMNRVVSNRNAKYAVDFGGDLHRHNTGAAQHHVAPDGVQSISVKELVEEYLENRVDCIKIDVEGMDLEVITSGKLEIARHKPVVCFETTISARVAASYDALFGADYVFFVNLEFRRTSVQTFIPYRLDRLAGHYASGQHDFFAVPRNSALDHRWSSYLNDADELNFRHALFLRQVGNVAQGDALLRTVVKPDRFPRLLALSDLSSRDGLHEQALAQAQAAIDISPNNFDGYLNAAVIAKRAKSPQLWHQFASMAAKRNPRVAAAVIHEAGALEANHRPEAAHQVLTHYLNGFGEHPQVLLALADVCWRLGHREDAVEKARRACVLRPTEIPGRGQLAIFLVRLGRVDEARQEMQFLERLLPGRPQVQLVRKRVDDLIEALPSQHARSKRGQL